MLFHGSSGMNVLGSAGQYSPNCLPTSPSRVSGIVYISISVPYSPKSMLLLLLILHSSCLWYAPKLLWTTAPHTNVPTYPHTRTWNTDREIVQLTTLYNRCRGSSRGETKSSWDWGAECGELGWYEATARLSSGYDSIACSLANPGLVSSSPTYVCR